LWSFEQTNERLRNLLTDDHEGRPYARQVTIRAALNSGAVLTPNSSLLASNSMNIPNALLSQRGMRLLKLPDDLDMLRALGFAFTAFHTCLGIEFAILVVHTKMGIHLFRQFG